MLSKSFSGEPLVIPFANRRQAGEKLAAKLTKYADRSDVLVLGLPRGGVEIHRMSSIFFHRTVILIDDGLATGSTMRAAATALRQMRPLKIIAAVPVAAPETCEEFRSEVDEVVCGAMPEPFMAIGAWYAEFSQTSDEEVRDLLA